MLKSIGGIENYGIVSLCLFVAIFSTVLLWACLQRKTHLDRLAHIPLEQDPEDGFNRTDSHE